LAHLRLRDRDAIITREGLIFRVLGYSHPREFFICDAEYASSKIFKSDDPRAPRGSGGELFYKFYEDEGWKFIQDRYPQYMILHEMLKRKVIGVSFNDIFATRKPDNVLQELLYSRRKDDLLSAMRSVVNVVSGSSNLSIEDFGVFGSMLHGFHHPTLSDIDLVIYGGKNLDRLRKALHELYESDSTVLKNEFETDQSVKGKTWHFHNLSSKEYVWHQRRKLTYALFRDQKTGRTIKTEFEPVKNWNEINNEYDSKTRIKSKGWVHILAKVTDDHESPFIPSVYGIEPQEICEGPRDAVETQRVVSYLEEFRMQAKQGEIVDVRGNLEEVSAPSGNFFQIALTYCPRYYEQVLKVKN
jgi:predicted nucleotidyltransferase